MFRLFNFGPGKSQCELRIRRLRKTTPTFERLESRDLFAWLDVISIPIPMLAGDGRIVDQSPSGGETGDSQATYDISLAAGNGPIYPEVPSDTRWGSSNGRFQLSGTYKVVVKPSEGEQVGDPVRIDLAASYRVTGGNGARHGNPRGHTDVSYEASAQLVGSSGTPITTSLFKGRQSAKEPFDSPTWDLIDFDSGMKTVLRKFEAHVGDTLNIPVALIGNSATWQGVATGRARGSVTGHVSLTTSVVSLRAFPPKV